MATLKCRYRNRRLYVEICGVETQICVGDIIMPGVCGLCVKMSVTGYQIFGDVAVAILAPLN